MNEENRCDTKEAFPSIDNLLKHKEDFEELLAEYGYVLAPRIVEYEVEQCEFPIEVLNEIRAIYAHLYRASVSADDSGAATNIAKAKSHSKRAILDCHKYLCVTYDTRYHEFFKKFKYVNWSKSMLSKDILDIDNKRAEAVQALKEAKVKESTERYSDNNIPESYDDYRTLYRIAYEKYLELMGMISCLENRMINSKTIVSRLPAFGVAVASAIGIALGFIAGIIL